MWCDINLRERKPFSPLKIVDSKLPEVKKSHLIITLEIVCIAIIMILAFTIRTLPLKWGAYLSEFDPYWHYYVAQYLVDNGAGWIFTDSWHDMRTWFPIGRDVASSTPMGLPLTAAAIFLLLKGAGFQTQLYDLAVYFPPFMAALTSLAIYFLGKDLGGREVGILSSLFIALSGAHIMRTTLGFFKHETIGVFTIIMVILLFLRAIDSKKSLKNCMIYSILAGLALFYLNISWGASFYMTGILPLFAIIAIIFKRYSTRLLIAYFITEGLGMALAAPFPRPGLGIIFSAGALPTLAGFFILALYEGLRHLQSLKAKWYIPTIICIVIPIIAFATLYQTGAIPTIASKFLTVINPALRGVGSSGAIVESVAEHRMSTWSTFYHSYGNILFLVPIGIYFGYKRASSRDIFIIIFVITALYATSSYIRLNLILAPALCLIGAFGLVEISKPLINGIKASLKSDEKKKSTLPQIDWRIGFTFITILILILAPTFLRAINSSEMPVTIASASIPLKEERDDWLDALAWIDKNIPKGTPVVCWWDYGYWVAIGGNSTSVADNGTIDTEQIAKIGQILLSNETKALDLCREYFSADYVLVFLTTAQHPQIGVHMPMGFGDEGKWTWMARIAEGFHPEINIQTVDKDDNGIPDPETLMGGLILYSIGYVEPEYFQSWDIVYVSPSHSYVIDNLDKPSTQVIILKGKS